MSKEISRRKALGAIAATGAAAAFGGAGTYAALTDNETAELILTGGSLVLKVAPKEQSFEPAQEYSATEGQAVEHTANWTISNSGTINASSLFLSGIAFEVSSLNGATKEEVLKGAELTQFNYAGEEVENFPATLWDLKHSAIPVELSSTADDVPELPAFEDETRELAIGIKFNYESISGSGGFSVTASPKFSAEQ